jgi:hypothetical protein
MTTPTTVSELIDAYGGPTAFSKALGLKNPSTASEMKRSGSIRPRYFVKIVETAPDHGIKGVDYEKLAMMHAVEEEAS